MNNETMGLGRDAFAPLPSEEAGLRPTWKAVYTIAERPNGRKHWLRIGVAFVNRDQSLNVRLDALPVNGQMHIREPAPRDPQGQGRESDDYRSVEFGG